MSDFFLLFEEIDKAVSDQFGSLMLPFKIIGRASLELAGLSDIGTKDLDALENELRIETLTGKQIDLVEKFLNAEFGKGSPGERRHGIYLDLVGSIARLPKHPRFIDERRYVSIVVSRLHPADVCVSKTFSYFSGDKGRGRDLPDIMQSLDAGIVDPGEYVRRVDESLRLYDMSSTASSIPSILRFLTEEIIPDYCDPGTKLTYNMPQWMENM